MLRVTFLTFTVRVLVILFAAGTLALHGASIASAQSSANAAKIQFSAAAELQNEGLFELAIGEWRSFLEKYPNDALAAKARHYLGVCLIQEKQYADAAVELAKVVAEHTKFEMLDEVLLNLGSAQYQIAVAADDPQRYGEPAATYGKLLTQFPQSKLVPTALYNQGECYYAMGQREKAAAAYDAFLKQFADHKLRSDAFYALGVTQLELKQAAAAQASFDEFLKSFPDHKLSTQVKMYKADALFDQEKFEQAEKLYAEVAATNGFELADRCVMRQADCLTSLKRYPQAADLFATIPQKFPESAHVPAATLAAGSRYHLAGNHEQAVSWLSKLTGEPAVEAAHWLARSYLVLKKPAEALTAVEKVLPQADQSDFLVDLLLDQADAAFELPDRRKDAVAMYLAIADKHADHPKAATALYNAGWAAFNVGQFDLANQYAARFLKAFPDHELRTAVQSVAADSHLNAGDLEQAEKIYTELLSGNPQHEDAQRWQLLKGWSLYRQKKYDPTVAHLQPLLANLKDTNSRTEALLLLGSSHFALKKYQEAKEELDQCVKADPKGDQADDALLLLSRAQRQLNDLEAAQATVRRLIDEFSDSELLDRAHYHLAEYLYSSEKYSEAAVACQKVLDTFPDSTIVPSALYWLGSSHLALEDYPAADKSLTQLLDQHGQHQLAASARYLRAQARRLAGNPAAAIEDLKSFLASDPARADRSGALFERGLAEMELKQFPAAIESFGAILKDDPQYDGVDKVKYQLAWSLKDANRPDKATDMFTQLADQHPRSPYAAEALYHVGEKQYADQQYPQAADTYAAAEKKAVAASQTDIAEMAVHKLGWSLYHQKSFPQAHEAFSRQLKSFADGKLATDARFMAAECLFEQDQFQQAFDGYNQLQENPPQSKDFQLLALLHAGQAANQLEQWDAAIELLEKVRDTFPDSARKPDILYEIAWAKQNKKQLDDALALYEEVSNLTQREVGACARLMMGEIKFEKGEHKRAIVDFFKVFKGYKGAPESYNRWKAQAMYEAARCFEVLENVKFAKRYYQQLLTDYPDNQLATLAKQRVAELK